MLPPLQCVKKLEIHLYFWQIKRGGGGELMESLKKDARRAPIIVDLDLLVPQDHLLRKIERVMDYEWLYQRLDPYYRHDCGRRWGSPPSRTRMMTTKLRPKAAAARRRLWNGPFPRRIQTAGCS